MKKIAIILSLFVNSDFAVFAQTSESDPQAENKDNVQYLVSKLKAEDSKSADLQSEIDRLKDEIGKLEVENGKLTDKLKSAQDNLKREQEAGKAAAYRDEIKQLKDEIKSLETSSASELSKQQYEAEKTQTALKQEIDSLKEQRDKDALAITDLTKELESLNEFKAMWLAQLANGVEEKWLNKGYSAIDLSELKQEYVQYERFAEWDPKVAEARDKMKVLLNEVRIYVEGQRLIALKYDKKSVEETAEKLKGLAVKGKDQTKEEELELLYRKLDDYGIIIEIFQDIIAAVDKEISGTSSSLSAWPLVKAVIKQNEDNGSIAAIKDIPWLAEQYESYYEALRKDCLGNNPARNLIKSLIP